MACLPLFLVIFIDGLGLGWFISIMNNIIVNSASDFLSFGVSASSRTFIYGLVVGIVVLSWFFGAAILGGLSDKIGRKKALIICLLGSVIGYSLAAFAPDTYAANSW